MSKKIKSKGLFILHEGIGSTIFNSQVVEHVSQLNKIDYEFDILSFNTDNKVWQRSKENRDKIISQNPALKIYLIKSINIFYPFAFLFHLVQLVKFLNNTSVKYSFIHSRSDYTQFIVLISNFCHKLNSVWDCRGDQISEINYALKKKNLIYKIYGFFYVIPLFKFIRYYNSIQSRNILFVSNLLKDTVYKIKNTLCKSFVIPCLVNESLFFFNSELRKIMRNKYDVKSNQSVFIYSGSMVAYQSFDLHKNLYNKILTDKDNLLFILTSDLEKAKIFFSQFESKNIIIESVDFLRINEYYNLADFALLIRNNNNLNKVASPTKFGEYCLAGLPVIMNKNVQQCFENSLEIGNHVNLNKSSYNKVDIKQRMLISKKSRSYYSRNSFTKLYQDLYKNLIRF